MNKYAGGGGGGAELPQQLVGGGLSPSAPPYSTPMGQTVDFIMSNMVKGSGHYNCRNG